MARKLCNRKGIAVMALAAVILLPAGAVAGLSAYLELGYSRSESDTSVTGGPRQSMNSDSFLQRYSIRAQNPITPYLSYDLGYRFEKDLLKSHAEGFDSETTRTRMSPQLGLSLVNPMFRLAVSYQETESKIDTKGAPQQILFQKQSSAFFGLARHSELPSLNIAYTHTANYDRDRVLQNMITDQVSVNSRYRPLRELELSYQGSYGDMRDKRAGVETKSLNNAGRASYSDRYWNSRVSVNADYYASFASSEVKATGTGEVSTVILPLAGLAGAGPLGTDLPSETITLDTLAVNPALIDGSTTADAGVNIGYSAATPGQRNMGLDLGTAVRVNAIHVWVNQQLPASVVNSFTWSVYISSDTTPLKQWTLLQTISPASFGVFDARFELRFVEATTRFIKVVTSPLASPVPVPGVDVTNIAVTEVQAFLVQPVQALQKDTNSITQTLDSGVRVRLSDVPNLLYDFYYWYTRTDPAGTSRYVMTNGLSLNQRLSRVFTASARVARDDAKEENLHWIGYTSSAALSAAPLSTLNHALTYNRRTNEAGADKSTQQSWSLTNSAALYRGVDLNLAGGLTDATSSSSPEIKTSYVSAGSTLKPLKTMTINAAYNDSKSRQVDTPDRNFNETIGKSASVAYIPVPAIYLYGSFDVATTVYKDSDTERTSRTQNYSLSWSPQTSGALTIRVSYSQTVTSADHGTTTILSPGVRWIIRPGASFDVSYQRFTTDNDFVLNRTGSVFGNLRLTLL